MFHVFERVCGVGIDGESNIRKLLAGSGHVLQIFSRLDLQLDPLISRAQLLFDFPYQSLRRFTNAERDSAGDLGLSTAQQFPKRKILLLRLDVPKSVLDTGFGHVMTTNALDE